MSDDVEVDRAINTIIKHLEKEWIVEGCEESGAFGCTSCQAVRLKSDLKALANMLDDGDPL